VLLAVKSSALTLTHVIPSHGKVNVGAVTSLDDDVFVLRHNSHQIEVYDAETFTLQRHLAVSEIGPRTNSITACARNKCVYLSEERSSCVHRVELSGRKTVKNWSVARGPTGLSVNNAHNLVVTCSGANKLQEYTNQGTLVREISLQGGLTSPWHAVQLSTGDYVVSQNTSSGVVSVVGVGGEVKYSYGQSQTSEIGKMKSPRSLAVTSNDDILVADDRNDRILSLNRSMSRVHALTLSVDDGIQHQRGLCLDKSRGRLYVGEWLGEHRVLVFDGVTTTP